MATVLDDLVEKYKALQADVSALFTKKQQSLSQFNENTLVKGVGNVVMDSNCSVPNTD